MLRQPSSQRGFSIAELLVVVAAITLLAAISLAAVTKARDKAIVTRVNADLSTLKNVVEMYRTQEAKEPCHEHAGTDFPETSWSAAYIKVWPKTPWRTTYSFEHEYTAGNQDTPTPGVHYYYLRITSMPLEAAVLYDSLFDDGNIAGGNFRSDGTISYERLFPIPSTASHCMS
jgi:general secretion pathway protein G